MATFRGTVPARIQSDPTRIRQILVNLVGNALKFTEKGTVTLRIHGADEGADLDTLRFEVQDTGIGIPADRVDTLFESFTQADSSTTRRFGGTGLGLSICKRLALLLEGDIVVESEDGQGSCFTFELGRKGLGDVTLEVDSNAEAVAVSSPLAEAEPKAKKKFLEGCRVLLAEDGTDNQRLIRFQLEKVGAEVEVVANGLLAYQSALEASKQESGYDIILMDMQMPEMDGYTATGKLREDGYEGPIIALTAHAMSGDRDKCLSAGCDDYATKPLVRKAFHETLKRYYSA